MINNGHPRIIPVGGELPPMYAADPQPKDRPATTTASKPKGKRTAAGRFRTLNAFIDFTLAELGRAELAVWLVLFRDSRDGVTRTGQADIARRAGAGRRTVYSAIRSLERRGLLQIVRRGRLGSGPSTYRLRWLTAD